MAGNGWNAAAQAVAAWRFTTIGNCKPALMLLGVLAGWGLGRTLGDAFQLSLDAVMGVTVLGFLVLAVLLGGRVIDLCSSWKTVQEAA